MRIVRNGVVGGIKTSIRIRSRGREEGKMPRGVRTLLLQEGKRVVSLRLRVRKPRGGRERWRRISRCSS